MDTPGTQIDYWDSVASEKKFAHPINMEKFSKFVLTDASILDLGCGYGRLMAQLHQQGYTNLVGADVSRKMIALARQTNPSLRFDVISDGDLPYPNAAFDAVLLVAVLTCIPSSDHQRRLVTEIKRILRPGGILYVSDCPLQEDARNVARYRHFASEYAEYGVFRVLDGGIVRHHDVSYLRLLLADFEELDVDYVDAITMNGNPIRAIRFMFRRRSS